MRHLSLLFLVACGPRTQDSASTLPQTGGDTDVPPEPVALRVATWNVESLGAVGSGQYEAVRTILARIDADVVAINEIDAFETEDLQALAADLGYATVVEPPSNPFGGLHNALLARVPGTNGRYHTSAELSGDAGANDVTRLPVSFTLDLGIVVAGNHLKSGYEDADEFRRTVDAIRLTQAPPVAADAIVCGDFNQEVTEAQDTPETFTDFPYGIPNDYYLGQDVYDQLVGPGLHNGPFPFLVDAGFTVVEAAQLDGSLATRNVSGRRIDYVMVGANLVDKVVGAEIYDARDDGTGAGLPKAGVAPERTASETASDHLPVFVDLLL